jgi:DNA modification methylase
MRQHVARGGLCYEPFCGSGSQIMAGEANGRRVYAMEISPAYVDVAIERWQKPRRSDPRAVLEMIMRMATATILPSLAFIAAILIVTVP